MGSQQATARTPRQSGCRVATSGARRRPFYCGDGQLDEERCMAIVQVVATMSVRGLLPAPSANADAFGVFGHAWPVPVCLPAGPSKSRASRHRSRASVSARKFGCGCRGEAWVKSSLVLSGWQAIRTFPSPAAIPNPAAFPKRRHGRMLTSPRSVR